MKFFTEKDGKKKILKRWKVLFVFAGVFVAILITCGGINLYNYIKRDYNQAGHDKYLESLQGKTTKDKKNVVLFLLDDMGYGDLSLTGSEAIKTPNIDKLATHGIFYNNYYAPNPICSASRAGLLTGRIPVRTLTSSAPEIFASVLTF